MRTLRTLKECVSAINRVDEDLVMCARKPWTGNSEIMLIRLDDTAPIPDEVQNMGYEYFLEIFVMLEVLEGLEEYRDFSLDEKIRILIYYAEYDAFPADL